MKVSISELQKKPSLLKSKKILEVIDKRDQKEVGIFIPIEYKKLIEEIELYEKRRKLQKIRQAKDDMEIWDEVVDDGL